MLTKIEKIKDLGVFSDFKWSESSAPFTSFNLIYGWNGCGKTTLSRLFRYLENNEFKPEDWEPEFKISTDSNQFDQKNPAFLSGSITVFNSDFVEQNIQWQSGKTNKLYIGQANQELSEELNATRKNYAEKKKAHELAKQQKEKSEKSQETFLSKRASEIKKRLTSTADDKYRTYNKNNIFSSLEKVKGSANLEQYKLEEEKEKSLSAQIQQPTKEQLKLIPSIIKIDKKILLETDKILKRTPATSFIETLKNDKDLNAWVKTGYEIHTSRDEKDCQFCLQPLPKERLKNLENHFSDEYKKFIDEVNAIGISIKQSLDKYSSIQLAPSKDLDQEYQNEYSASQTEFYQLKDPWKVAIEELLNVLRNKNKNPFESIESHQIEKIEQLEEKILSLLSKCNLILEEHNEKTKNIGAHIKSAKEAIEYATVTELLEEYVELEKDIQDSKIKVGVLYKETSDLEKKVEELESKAISTKIAVSEINRNLQSFLGRNDLKLTDEDEGYSITRNGKKAKNLSEGEKTAIALIYFFSKIKEGASIKDKIIVIDDPISSLDSQATHFALSFIKENIYDASQIFLLTHNFYCLKEVKNWRRRDFKKNAFNCYMLECRSVDTQRATKILPLDRLLDNYESEYHYLFSKLIEWYEAQPFEASLEEMYPLATMARKVLETFVAFKYPQTPELRKKINLVKKLNDVEKTRLIRFLDVMAHADSPERIVEFPHSSIEEMGEVIRVLIEFIKATDIEHFNGMKGAIASSKQSEEAKKEAA